MYLHLRVMMRCEAYSSRIVEMVFEFHRIEVMK